MRDILNNHRDFELADEQTIAAHGRVEQENGHPVFRVGYQTYRLVVLPEIYTLDIVTLRLLEKFSQAGGTIISAGALPERVDGAVPTRVRRRNGCLPFCVRLVSRASPMKP